MFSILYLNEVVYLCWREVAKRVECVSFLSLESTVSVLFCFTQPEQEPPDFGHLWRAMSALRV